VSSALQLPGIEGRKGNHGAAEALPVTMGARELFSRAGASTQQLATAAQFKK
jgi:hypothetical protein